MNVPTDVVHDHVLNTAAARALRVILVRKRSDALQLLVQLGLNGGFEFCCSFIAVSAL